MINPYDAAAELVGSRAEILRQKDLLDDSLKSNGWNSASLVSMIMAIDAIRDEQVCRRRFLASFLEHDVPIYLEFDPDSKTSIGLGDVARGIVSDDPKEIVGSDRTGFDGLMHLANVMVIARVEVELAAAASGLLGSHTFAEWQ